MVNVRVNPNKFFGVLFAIIAIFVAWIYAATSPTPSLTNTDEAQKHQLNLHEGKIKSVLIEKEVEVMGRTQLYQKLEVAVTQGELVGQTVTIENGDLPIVNQQRYKAGDVVKFASSESETGGTFYYITDYVRRYTIFQLLLVFALCVVVIGGWRGLTSLFGLVYSFFVIITGMLPRLLAGFDPIAVAIVGSMIIAPVTFSLSHGFNRKTVAAVTGTGFALVATGVLAAVFVRATQLSGYVAEEVGFLQVNLSGVLNPRGLLLAGIIIGALGVMDDITVSQSAIVWQLHKAAPQANVKEIFLRAMSVGRDHIASMVNTLILVYTGASLPLLLLFINAQNRLSEVIDFEPVAQEIVRTFVGSIGLILAVPVTTAIACLLLEKQTVKKTKNA